MTEPTKPPHIDEDDWNSFKLYVNSNGSPLTEENYEQWWAEYNRVKQISGEA
jgi:hypothetical protein